MDQSPYSALDDRDNASQLIIRTGASDLVAQLLASAGPAWNFDVLGPSLQPPVSNSLKHNASSIIDLDESDSFYRVVRRRPVGKTPTWHAPPTEKASIAAAKASTVIISGSGEALQDVEPALDFLQRVRPRFIIHHMTRPLARGRLWDIIRDGPRTRDGIPDPDHLAVIIDAEDLRAEGISLSRSLSWEKTAEDFVRNLGSNGRLDTLVTCPNLIVRFGNEGVIHHRGRDAVNPKLYFNPRQVEHGGQAAISGDMIGQASAFTAGFTLGFAKPPHDTERAIRLACSAAQKLNQIGFIKNDADGAPDYPVDAVVDDLSPETTFSVVSIPSGRISSGDSWSIFESLTGDPAELARLVVTSGPQKALVQCPLQRFGELLSIERSERESLCAAIETVNERVRSQTAKPTCIGIIGQPGAGKKFVASNLATHLCADPDTKRLVFNARILGQEDLVALCQTARDYTASGSFVVITFENVEAIMDPRSEILSAFLVLMRDGLFTDRNHSHHLGSVLFIFLINQSETTIIDGTPTPTQPDFRSYRPLDETILLDYLHGVVRVSGPNQTSADDKLFPVRRAMMLRHMLTQKFPHLLKNDTIKIDEAVLHAMLLVPAYKHGLRSLEKILSTSRLTGRAKFEISALPPEEFIQMHVDGRVFMSFLRSPKLPASLRELLAVGLFEAYKKKRREMSRTPEEKEALLSDPAICDWDELAPELKESTRAQADDIPRKLRAVGCFMLDTDRTEPLVRVPEFTTEELDMLSEMEHERFNAERLQRQWRMGPRSSGKKTTPFLVPWRDLTQDWKDVDRVMVECVPRVLLSAGWKIYRMQESADQNSTSARNATSNSVWRYMKVPQVPEVADQKSAMGVNTAG